MLICDDDPRIRIALEALGDAYPDLAVAGIAHNGAEAIDLARLHRPADATSTPVMEIVATIRTLAAS